jgi:ADP-ribosyl-[dinitrogen reductase] hydrolase
MVSTNLDLTTSAGEDRFLGGLLGMAIGDALGMPVAGWDADRIADRLGPIDGYHLRVLPDGTEVAAGEITDETEFALAIVEALTTNAGKLTPDTIDSIGSRLLYLANGDSAHWLAADTRAALRREDSTLDFVVPLTDDGPSTGDVAARGVPIGLLHAVGRFDADALRKDAEAVTRLTHGAPAAIAATTAVAYGVMLAARSVPPDLWLSETAAFLGEGEMAVALRSAAAMPSGRDLAADLAAVGTGLASTQSVAAGFVAASRTESFSDAVFAAANAGGAADTVGAIAGALAGAYGGDTSVPQPLIDGLGSRIYVSLAAPWFFRTAQQRAGLFIGLRPAPPSRPTEPPRV